MAILGDYCPSGQKQSPRHFSCSFPLSCSSTMSGGFYRGTTLEQDSRFADKQQQLLKRMNFPSEYDCKIDLAKVRLEVIKPWCEPHSNKGGERGACRAENACADSLLVCLPRCCCRIGHRIQEILGFEDDVVVVLIFNSLESAAKASSSKSGGTKGAGLDPRELQITLTGFLEKSAKPFVLELWKLLLSAASTPTGIPQQMIEAKKAEMLQEQTKQRDMIAAAANAARIAAGLSVAAAASTAPAASAAVVGGADGSRKRASRFGPPATVRAPLARSHS